MSEHHHRGSFGSKLGIILATAGSAVGLGNIWRFPYMTGQNGGAAFIVIYLVCVFLLGVPGMVAEFVVGRHASSNAARAYSLLAKGTPWRVIGYIGVFTSMIILGFYAVVAGWCLQYLMVSLLGQLHGDAAFVADYFTRFSSHPLIPVGWALLFILLTHFGCHPDTVGGCVISADWPGFVRRTLEKTLDHVKCVLFNGAQGDVNHVNTAPGDGDLNDLTLDFDDVMRGYGHARYMGRAVAGAALQVYDKVNWVEKPSVCAAQRVIRWPSNRPKPEELPLARLYDGLHRAGRDSEIPYQGMMLTTVVAEADRMLRLEHGPEDFALRLSAAAVGPVAFAGIPGEPFTETGRAIAGAAGWGLALPCCCVNGYENYFPLMKDYLDGGYEARSSLFRAGVAEAVADGCLSLLKTLREQEARNHAQAL